VDIKVKGEEVDKCFGNVELIARKTKEQPTKNQITMTNTNTLTPYSKILSTV